MSKNSLRSAIQGLDIRTPYGTKNTSREIQSEVPQKEAPSIDTPSGFFMMAHSVFMNSVLRELTGDGFRVFLWMSAQAYRFKEASGTLRASIGFIQAGTGVSAATVSRILESLVKKKLIERIEVNSHKGNLWKVSRVAVWAPDPNVPPEGTRQKGTHNEVPQPSDKAPSKVEGSSTKMRGEYPRVEGQIKISILQNSKNLFTYFNQLKPERKRQAEWKALESMKHQFSQDEIEEGHSMLLKEDPNLTKYHSPMAYLSHALPQVLQKAVRQAAAAERSSGTKVCKEASDQREFEEEQIWIEKESAFQAAFPDAESQDRAIEKYTAGSTVLAHSGKSLRRGLAIVRWWDDAFRVKRGNAS